MTKAEQIELVIITVANSNLLKIALQYVQDFDSLVLLFHKTKKIKGYGVANEGIVSTRLGLKEF
jgi:dihydroorotase